MKATISYLLLILGLATPGTILAGTPSPSTTTLSFSSSTVAKNVAVTLTAAVNSGGKTVSPGRVLFCDATLPHCEDVAILGTAQLTSAGTASIKLTLGLGPHSIKAVFVGTNTVAGSSSADQSLTVAGKYPTTSLVFSFGTPGKNGLEVFVESRTSGFREPSALPAGNISFLDAMTNRVLATAAFQNGSAPQATWAADPTVSYITGNAPAAVAVGDFNGDGKPDLAVANQNGAGSFVGMYLNKGDGTFQPQVAYATGNTPAAIAVEDFNSDGKLDLVTVNRADNSVSVLLGNGDGTFQTATAYPVGSVPLSLAVEDFNGDGIPDLATVNSNDNTVSVLLGKGDGTFQPQLTYPTGHAPYSVVVADFNKDGKQDMAIANSQDLTVGVFLGNGDGTFKPQVTYDVNDQIGDIPVSLAVADFGQNGNPDIEVLNTATGINNGGTFVELGNNGDGTFQSSGPNYGVGRYPSYIMVADFDGDGIPDLAIANNGSPDQVLLSSTGSKALPLSDNTFRAIDNGNIHPNSLAAGDFNGDGLTDLASTNNSTNGLPANLGIQLTYHGVTSYAVATSVNAGSAQYFYSYYPGDSNYEGSLSCQIGLNTTERAPVISGVTVSNIKPTSATISWTSNVATYGGVNYGLTTALDSKTPWVVPVSTAHSFTLTNLTPGSTYNYQAWSVSYFNYCTHWTTSSPTATFTTATK